MHTHSDTHTLSPVSSSSVLGSSVLYICSISRMPPKILELLDPPFLSDHFPLQLTPRQLLGFPLLDKPAVLA